MKTVLHPNCEDSLVVLTRTSKRSENLSHIPGGGCDEFCATWTTLIGDQEWAVYVAAIEALHKVGIQFVLGGAFGLATYTGRCRNTKDMDLFLRPADRERAIAALTDAGFADYYQKVPYDRGWIYRATRDDMIVDLIWGTPNRRGEVDDQWFTGTRSIQIRDAVLQAIPAEELLWIKLFVMQRDRCDWPDVINLLYATSGELDWERVLARLGPQDRPLLQGLVCLFTWLCPGRLHDIPFALRQELGLPLTTPDPTECREDRIRLLDSRPWFAGLQPCDKPMSA